MSTESRISRRDFLKVGGVIGVTGALDIMFPRTRRVEASRGGPEAERFTGVRVDMKLQETGDPSLSGDLYTLNRLEDANINVKKLIPVMSGWFRRRPTLAIAGIDQVTFTPTENTPGSVSKEPTVQWVVKMIVDPDNASRTNRHPFALNVLMVEKDKNSFVFPIVNEPDKVTDLYFKPKNYLFIPVIEHDLSNYDDIQEALRGTLRLPSAVAGGEPYIDKGNFIFKRKSNVTVRPWLLAHEDPYGNPVNVFNDPRKGEQMVVIEKSIKDIRLPGSLIDPTSFGWENYPPLNGPFSVKQGYSPNYSNRGLIADSLAGNGQKPVSAEYDYQTKLWKWKAAE